jgi:hypothetical protein
VFEDIRAAFESALDAAMGNTVGSVSQMRDAVIEAKAALKYMEEGLANTEAKLSAEARNLEDAVRRGGMAADIGDEETASIAEEFAARHREKVGVLERKLEAQRSEMDIARREVREMTEQLKAAQRGTPGMSSSRSAGVGAGDGEGGGDGGEALRSELDQHAKETFAQRQLEELKRRMGK